MQELPLPVKPATIVSTMKGLATCLVALSLMMSSAAYARRHQARKGIPTYTRTGDPNIQAQAALVIDLTEGHELFMKNPDAVRPIASISKLMAMLAVLDRNLQLDAATTMIESDRKIATGGARSRLPIGM